MPKKFTAYFLLILATGLWGIGGPIIKHSYTFITPFEFLFWRYAIVSILALPILIWYFKKNPLAFKDIPKIVTLAFFGSVLNLALSFIALEKTSVIEATIIGSLNPMMVVICSSIFLGDYIGQGKKMGIALAIAGSVVAIVNPLLDGDMHKGQSLFGNLLIILSGVSWIFFVMLSKKWDETSIRPFHIVSFSAFTAAFSFFVLSTLYSGHMPKIEILESGAVYGVVYMAVFGTLIGYSAYTTALKIVQASEADIFNYLSPLWAIPIAIFWLEERFDPALIISAILIIFGVYLAERKECLKKALKPHHLAHHK